MKRLIALLLALITVFSLVSCEIPEDVISDCKHKDKDGDGICDKCDADIEAENELKAAVLAATVMNQLNTAESMKVDFNLDVDVNANVWDGDYDYESDSYRDVHETHNKVKAKFHGTIDLVKNGESFNAKIHMKADLDLQENEEHEKENEEYTVYLIDGILYLFDKEENVYIKLDNVDTAEIEKTLSALLAGVELDAEKTQEMASTVADKLVTAMNIEAGKGGSYTFKGKKLANDLVTYIKDLDMDEDTVGGVLDDVLALISKDLTTAKIVAELERISDLTVNEALAELDAWLTKEYNTTVGQLYDALVANDAFMAIVRGVLEEIYDDEKEVLAQLVMLRSLTVDQMIAEAGIGNTTLWDLFVYYIGEGAPDKAELFLEIKYFLALSLSNFEAMTGTPVFTELKAAVSTLNFTALDMTAKLALTKKNELERFSVDANLGLNVKPDSHVAEGKQDHYVVNVKLSFGLHGVSDKPAEISLPKDATVVNASEMQ